ARHLRRQRRRPVEQTPDQAQGGQNQNAYTEGLVLRHQIEPSTQPIGLVDAPGPDELDDDQSRNQPVEQLTDEAVSTLGITNRQAHRAPLSRWSAQTIAPFAKKRWLLSQAA